MDKGEDGRHVRVRFLRATRCMAVLAHRPTAITPRHYVICRTAPSDPADPTAWPAPLAAGTGRA